MPVSSQVWSSIVARSSKLMITAYCAVASVVQQFSKEKRGGKGQQQIALPTDENAVVGINGRLG